MNESATPYVKVLFLVTSEDGLAHTETMWATDMGDDRYRLENSPFYAYSVSWDDIVYAPFDPAQGFRTFQSVTAKSGNRTIRVRFNPPVAAGNESDGILAGLVKLGCSYECATKSEYSINLPPAVDIFKIRDYLIACGATWEHADPTYDELYPDQK